LNGESTERIAPSRMTTSAPAAPPPAPQQLAEVLELGRLDSNLFRSRVNQVNVNRSLFGGQILGQGLQAAAQTVAEDRQAHSLHGYFLLAGASDIPVIYDDEQLVTRMQQVIFIGMTGYWPGFHSLAGRDPRD
jgi:hypothetical protein